MSAESITGTARGEERGRYRYGFLAGASGWLVVALILRAPFVWRAEGILDHDQSVVGLMALDIAAGRRFPLFFDGQRYMAAVEAYLAALAVALLGHSPTSVAVAPWLFEALFVAGQFVVWGRWKGRRTGHLAAAASLLGPPMLCIWSIVPRGGYVEFLAWVLPTIAVYRRVTCPDTAPLSPIQQAGWGFLLALGYLLNPLSLTVYTTLAVDWTLFRHGAELRRLRNLDLGWLQPRWAPWVWLGAVLGGLTLLAACCHVEPRATTGGPYVVLAGIASGRTAVAAGATGVVAILGLIVWWSNGARRLLDSLTCSPWTLAGLLVALSPFLLQASLVRLGMRDDVPTLPVWISAPWDSATNLRTAATAVGGLLGTDTASAYRSLLIGQGIDLPDPANPRLTAVLHAISPGIVVVVLILVALATWRVREAWTESLQLRASTATDPVVLCGLYLFVAFVLYLVQGTSPNASSTRYLMPTWAVLPGLIATGLVALPRSTRLVVTLGVFIPWMAAQAAIFSDINREHEARPLARWLAEHRVEAIVAPPPVALLVANLTHGIVGAVEYQPTWPRLASRYRARLEREEPIVCVTDDRFPWAIAGEVAWAREQDFARHLASLARRAPGRCRVDSRLGPYRIWMVSFPVDVILALEDD
ncbi:MAG: hypothetical protein U0794_18620 [Isosphaeraceae bacterium]